MLENKPVDHFCVSRVHFQSHPVFGEADDVGVQKKAGLDHFFSKFTVYMHTDNPFRQMAKKRDGHCWESQAQYESTLVTRHVYSQVPRTGFTLHQLR